MPSSATCATPPAVPASLDGLDPAGLRQLRDRLRVQVSVLALTTPAGAARPATWLSLRELMAGARGGPGGAGEDWAAVTGPLRAALDVAACIRGARPVGQEAGGAARVAGVIPPAPGRPPVGPADDGLGALRVMPA